MTSKFQFFSFLFLLLLTACGTTSQLTRTIPLSATIPTTFLTTTSVPQDSADVYNSTAQDLVTPTPTPLPVDQAIISTVLPQQYAIPIFTVPGDWLLYSSSYPTYRVYYPPNANLEVYMPAQRLTVHLPKQFDMQMLERQLIIESRSAPVEGCYHLSVELQLPTTTGITQINGVDFVYVEDISWHPLLPSGSKKWEIFQIYYVTSLPQNGFCHTIVLQMIKLVDSDVAVVTPIPTPSPYTNIEILLDILSTLQLF